MASRVQADEPGMNTVRHIVRTETRKALEGLSERWPVADQAIHDARKRLKKARAGLRLVRDALGRGAYRRENVLLRDAARPLSQLRDARVLIGAFDDLVEKSAPTERADFAPLREALVANEAKVRRRVLRNKDCLKPVLTSLRSARKDATDWRDGRHGWLDLRPGLRQVYRAGRKAFAAARERPSVERLHEWRKQAKYHWHHLQILRRSGQHS